MLVIQSQNLDSSQAMFFARQLEVVRAETYDIKYADLKGRTLVNIEQDNPGAEVITYTQFDRAGIFKLIANYADDLPRSDVFGKQFSAKVFGFGGSYGYSIQDIRAAMMAGGRLDQKRARNVREISDSTHDRMIYFGNSEAGFTGLFNNPNITTGNVVAGVSTTTQWATKTPDEILTDLNSAYTDVLVLTNETEVPNTLLLPVEQHAAITSRARSINSDTTILEFFLRNRPNITRVETVVQLANIGNRADMPDTVGDAFMFYKKSPDVLGYRAPVWFEQFAPQQINLAFNVPCHSRSGGVAYYRPLAAVIKGGI